MATPPTPPAIKPIERAAVIGAGVMGAGIAAQLANAGIPVLLLDIVPGNLPAGADRSVIAKTAIEKLLKSKPEPLMHPGAAALITPGNIEDDLPQLKNIDWVIEAVIERLDIKHSLYAKIAKVRGAHTVVSSNTSTLPLAALLKGVPDKMAPYFFITHFFNPPRYMRLLEVISTKKTDPAALARVRFTADHKLGKSLVDCADTPGFIANRIGTFWLHAASSLAVKNGITVEEADAALGKPAGVPATGVFGLMDLVGLDLMPHVLNSLAAALPPGDAFHTIGAPPKLFAEMIAQGLTGRKGKGGFYRLNEAKEKLVINLTHGTYAPVAKPKVGAVLAAKKAGKKGGLKALITHPSPVGQYADAVLTGTLAYAASLLGEIAGDADSIDRAMRLGYNWGDGPFELIDKLGTAWFATHLRAKNLPVPKIIQLANGRPIYRFEKGVRQQLTLKGTYAEVPKPAGVLSLAHIKRQTQPLYKNLSASVWDAGDGVAVLEFHSKMNSFDPFTLRAINTALTMLPARGFKGLVIYNEAPNFSVGANLLMLRITSVLRQWWLIDWILRHGQSTFQRMKYAENLVVVGAPSGMALGGGAEVLLHCHVVVAGAETYMGLVEAGVGIVPGWGGCKELLGRALSHPKRKGGPMPAIASVFETIATAKVATSARQAQKMGLLKETDTVVMNPDRLLATAKARALELAASKPKAPTPFTYALPGPTGAAALQLALHDFTLKGLATPHDGVVGKALAGVLTGGATDITCAPLTEDALLHLERQALVKLAKTPATRARIAHLLATGKPLRN